jgi:hypothetical protein
MPKSYLTLAEREKAAAMRERDKQVKAVSLELCSLKNKNGGFSRLQKKTGISRPTLTKIANEPLRATLEQLYAVAFASGKKVVITIE